MKKIIILLVVPLFFGFKTGDEFDEKKMNRDIEIAKNILSTLINTGNDTWFGGSSIDATYIKDYGVVFTIPEHLVYFHNGGNMLVIPDIPPIPDVDVTFDEDFEWSLEETEGEKQEMKLQRKIMKEHEKELKKQQFEVQKQAKEIEKAHEDAREALAEARDRDDFYVAGGQTSEINWEEIMITFMTDYADLIGQLEPQERIVIKQQSPYRKMMFIWQGEGTRETIENENTSISAEVLRKDVSAFKAGQIKRGEFVKRIDIKKSEPPKKVADLEMFANIFDRFYSHDLTETFYSQGKPSYEVLDGFGVVFHIKATSGNSRSYARIRYRSSGSSAYTIVPNDDNSKDVELYQKFKEDLKAFMLDYGRTIRSLDNDDKVMLDIKLNTCRDCDVPESMEVSIKMSALKQYDQQKISREKALSQIVIKEN